MINDALKTLKLDQSAGPDEIRKAYIRLVRRFPPEHFPEKFVVIHQAYRLLSLDDVTLSELAGRFSSIRDHLELGALLWGDRDELRREVEIDWLEIENLLKKDVKNDELQSIIYNVDISSIIWRK